tara:strand:+ start:287 stop:1147 length:861 start_codon:yes stop_codon:yes gene_type:complete
MPETKTLNSINNALQGAGSAVNRIAGGSISQPGISILGTNIPLQPLISTREVFLDSLSQWTNAIPLTTQFIVLFDFFPIGLNTTVMQKLEPVVQSNGFDISVSKNLLTNLKNQSIIGCIFANGFQIASESLGYANAPIQNNRGFIPGTILGNRQAFSENEFTLNFRETNTSFVDQVIRPWLIMASHFGYVARDESDPIEQLKSVKTNITVLQYTRSKEGLSQIPRKTWRFYNCVPVSLDTRTGDYNPDQEGIQNYSVKWVYDKYEISNNLYFSVRNLIQSINPFSF